MGIINKNVQKDYNCTTCSHQLICHQALIERLDIIAR